MPPTYFLAHPLAHHLAGHAHHGASLTLAGIYNNPTAVVVACVIALLFIWIRPSRRQSGN